MDAETSAVDELSRSPLNAEDIGQLLQEMRLKDFAIESSINAIGLGDLEGNLTYVNAAFVRMWGGERSEILGQPVVKFAQSREEAETIIHQVLEQGSWFGEITGRNKPGNLVHVELSASLVADGQGRPVCLFCSFVDISERKKAEDALNRAKDELEAKVRERTRSLEAANEQLQQEVEDRIQVEGQLRFKEQELELKASHLEEVNTALKVLLKKREQDWEELESRMVANVKDLIMPYLAELEQTGLSSHQAAYLQIVASTLENIISPFARRLSSRSLSLTPNQLKVAELIKSGRSTKEIAELMQISDRAVEFHRNNIRSKLGLKHKKVNLRSYLMSLA